MIGACNDVDQMNPYFHHGLLACAYRVDQHKVIHKCGITVANIPASEGRVDQYMVTVSSRYLGPGTDNATFKQCNLVKCVNGHYKYECHRGMSNYFRVSSNDFFRFIDQ